MQYRKKPVVIEAIVWNNNFEEIFNFMDADNNLGIVGYEGDILQVRTLEGIHNAQIGDYIIKGVKGEFYPCKPNIFEMTYELASTLPQTEISDEEIDNAWEMFRIQNPNTVGGFQEQYASFLFAIKWYREQLKQRL
jgi:hypothetical protein